MSLESKLGQYFKSEIKNEGLKEFKKATVFISNHSDTQIQASMKSMIPIRISLRSESISNPEFSAKCNCNVFSKGHLCKHIWAVLLTVEQKYPDFLDSKTEIQSAPVDIDPKKEEMKAKQKEFQKVQYEKQKLRLRTRKQEQKRAETEPVSEKYPAHIESALEFFLENGFKIEATTKPDVLNKIKKTLYRVFHPDKGGSHDEAVALNKHYDVLIEFLNTNSDEE